jgi:hypothetical protein
MSTGLVRKSSAAGLQTVCGLFELGGEAAHFSEADDSRGGRPACVRAFAATSRPAHDCPDLHSDR